MTMSFNSDQQHHRDNDWFVGRQLPNGWFVGTNVNMDWLAWVALAVLLLPVIAARWLWEHGGPLVLVLGVGFAWALMRWLLIHPVGRVVRWLAAGLALGFVIGFGLAFVAALLWVMAGVFT